MTASREVRAVIHLWAPPGDFPNTLCGLDGSWGASYAAVYGKDLDIVSCADCLARVEPRSALYPDQKRKPDMAYVMCWVLVCSAALLILLWSVGP